MKNKKTALSEAYSLKTPEDSIKLYKDWAKDYDKDFAENTNYLSPLKISNLYKKYSKITDKPILDVGAGTGLIGKYINKDKTNKDIIGIDNSPEMLKVAESKKYYYRLLEADVTKRIPLQNNSIGSVVSAGTFTHGHVGPIAFDELLRVTKPKGLFVLSIHCELFIKAGFKKKLYKLKDKITKPILKIFKIYGKNNNNKHGNDKAYALIFRKL